MAEIRVVVVVVVVVVEVEVDIARPWALALARWTSRK